MKLHQLHRLRESANDLSLVPEPIMKKIGSTMITLVKDDPDKSWANALELVHAAYTENNVDRPAPFMRDAWAQYEFNIQLAVQTLSKLCNNNNWRSTTAG